MYFSSLLLSLTCSQLGLCICTCLAMFINFYVCLHCRGRVITKDVRTCESISIQRDWVKYEIEPCYVISNNVAFNKCRLIRACAAYF